MLGFVQQQPFHPSCSVSSQLLCLPTLAVVPVDLAVSSLLPTFFIFFPG
jgi:hypothetical protein